MVRLVRESISFERGRDPKAALGLKPYDAYLIDNLNFSYDGIHDKEKKLLKDFFESPIYFIGNYDADDNVWLQLREWVDNGNIITQEKYRNEPSGTKNPVNIFTGIENPIIGKIAMIGHADTIRFKENWFGKSLTYFGDVKAAEYLKLDTKELNRDLGLLQESISFERGRNPKEALFHSNPEDWWNNLAPGDWFVLLKEIPTLSYHIGDYFKVLKVRPLRGEPERLEINRDMYNTEGKLIGENRQWSFGFEFFKEYFRKIEYNNESLSFERVKDPKAALGLSIAGDLLKFADKKVKEKDWSWVGLKGDSEFKEADNWAWEIEFEPSLDRATKDLWIDWLKKIKKYNDIKREE